jgi:hypothetical protein
MGKRINLIAALILFIISGYVILNLYDYYEIDKLYQLCLDVCSCYYNCCLLLVLPYSPK